MKDCAVVLSQAFERLARAQGDVAAIDAVIVLLSDVLRRVQRERDSARRLAWERSAPGRSRLRGACEGFVEAQFWASEAERLFDSALELRRRALMREVAA